MNEKIRVTVLRGLNALKGDNLARAMYAFKNKTPEEMNQEYGSSGKTRSEILKEYEQHEADVKSAIEWVNAYGDHPFNP